MNNPSTQGALQKRCDQLQSRRPLTTRQILEPFGLLEGHPWADAAASDLTTYYACLHGIAQAEQPRKILEIGSAFGMSGATFLSASPEVQLFVSLDLGIYGELLGSARSNIDFAREHLHQWCANRKIDTRRVRFYRANTQPPGKGDNDNQGLEVSRWSLIPEAMRLLQDNQFDIIFVDGKHTEDGLFNDMRTFWPFLKPGGLMICDDLHHPEEYAGAFSWVGHTWQSYHRFLAETHAEIADHCLWNFPAVPPEGKMGLRPFGLLRKHAQSFPAVQNPGFEMFDSEPAARINRTRQDHLASLGLDLTHRSVLEVGAGVGWHTGFFERLSCRVLTTEARPENLHETLRRFPHRQGKLECADLAQPGGHARFGEFDVVYCYGTLYHLGEPALCLAELSRNCRHLLLLETIVNPVDNHQINPAIEDASNPNQSVHGQGCRPGRDWVMTELRQHFPHVYVSKTQPDFPDFSPRWPVEHPAPGQNTRAVFVASREPLNLPTLSEVLLGEQSILPPVLNLQPTGGLTSSAEAIAPEKPASIFFDIHPAASLDGLEKSVYGPSATNELIRDGAALIFNPTTDRDHFATKFQPVRLPAAAAVHCAALEAIYPDRPNCERMIVALQDQRFNVLTKTPGAANQAPVRLPAGTTALRLVFLAPSAKPCVFPAQVTIKVSFPVNPPQPAPVPKPPPAPAFSPFTLAQTPPSSVPISPAPRLVPAADLPVEAFNQLLAK